MRLILMGTGSFAVPTFRALLDSNHDVAAIVTRPVPPARGRQKGPANPVLATFAATGIPMLDPSDINDAAVRAIGSVESGLVRGLRLWTDPFESDAGGVALRGR